MPNSPIVAKSLVFHQDRVLLLVRADHDLNRPGDFDLPGGGVDVRDGTIAGAASREIYEETKLVISPDTLQEVALPAHFAQVGVERHVFIGIADTTNVTIDPREHKSYQWVALAEAIRMFQHPFYSPVMEYVLSERIA